MPTAQSPPIRIAILGAGAVSDYHHVPGIRIDPRAELVAICDASEALLQQRRSDWDVERATTDYGAICADPDIDAIIIATPNFTHRDGARCRGPAAHHAKTGLDAAQVRAMYVARDTKVVHDGLHLSICPVDALYAASDTSGAAGELRHFRSQRFLDWPEALGVAAMHDKAGAGDLFDADHSRRLYAGLMGRIEKVSSAMRSSPRDKTPQGDACLPSDVDDWSAILGNLPVAAWPVRTTLARGWAEWIRPRMGRNQRLGAIRRLPVAPAQPVVAGPHRPGYRTHRCASRIPRTSGSPRDPADGEPATVFRYDLVAGIRLGGVEGREAMPSFHHGLVAQVVADSVLQSYENRTWLDIPEEPPTKKFYESRTVPSCGERNGVSLHHIVNHAI